MTSTGDHPAPGADAVRQRVAHGLEDLGMPARDDELSERRAGEIVERHLRLPRRPLAEQQLDAAADRLGENARGPVRRSDAEPEELKELARIDLVPSAVELLAVGASIALATSIRSRVMRATGPSPS